MQWEKFVEKVYNVWSYETAASRISMLESLGAPSEIADLVQYALDEKGSVKLLKRAMSEDIRFADTDILSMAECLEEKHADVLVEYFLKQGQRFQPQTAVDMYGNCSDAMLNRVIRATNAPFTKDQIEELDGCVDEDLLRDLYAGTGIQISKDEDEEDDFILPEQYRTDENGTGQRQAESVPIKAAFGDTEDIPEKTPKQHGILHTVRRTLFPKKYIYVFVLFESGNHAYAYRTTDKTIKAGDVVVVPVAGNDRKAAYVDEVRVVTEDNLPYPLEKTKMVLGRAKKKEVKEFLDEDMRLPMDISYCRVKTKDGIKEITTTEEERAPLRKKYKNHPTIKTIETRKPAKRSGKKDNLDWIDELEFFDAIFDDK